MELEEFFQLIENLEFSQLIYNLFGDFPNSLGKSQIN